MLQGEAAAEVSTKQLEELQLLEQAEEVAEASVSEGVEGQQPVK